MKLCAADLVPVWLWQAVERILRSWSASGHENDFAEETSTADFLTMSPNLPPPAEMIRTVRYQLWGIPPLIIHLFRGDA